MPPTPHPPPHPPPHPTHPHPPHPPPPVDAPPPRPPPPLPRSIPLGLRALDTTPMKPGKGEPGQRDVPVVVSGTVIFPGDWLYSDEGG